MIQDKCNVNLFILGAAKCGTTSLHNALQQHPNVFMSTPKEPFFFEAEYERGVEYYIDRYFSAWSGETIVGESRHRNLYLPFVADRIQETYPDASFIVIVRHPVNRAYSHWWHWFSRGVEKKSFEQIVEDNFLRLREGPFFDTPQSAKLYEDTLDRRNGYSPFPSYIDSGYYADQIHRYIDRFGKSRVHIMLFDDFVADPEHELGAVYDFLEIVHQGNIGSEPQNRAMSKLGVKVVGFVRELPFKKVLPFKYRKMLMATLRMAFANSVLMSSMDMKLRERLIDHYEPYTSALEKLIERKLPGWRE